MSPMDNLLLLLKKKPGQTALELWVELAKSRIKDPATYKRIKTYFPDEDQSIREALAVAEENGAVKHKIRWNSILKEWSLT